MRLIDADKAIGHIKKRLLETALNNSDAVCDASFLYAEIADNRIETWIDEEPTVDAVPVRHGKWKQSGDRWEGIVTTAVGYICSECGYFGEHTDNYCPNCGCRMEVSEDE